MRHPKKLIFAVIVCLSDTLVPVTLVELFPAKIRYTAMSFSYNLAFGIFGGTAPLVSTFLIEQTKNLLSPSFYLRSAGFVMVVLLFTVKETAKTTL